MLQKSALQGGLKNVFDGVGGYPAATAAAGVRWAQAYLVYAKDAQAGAAAAATFPTTTIDAAGTTLGSALGPAFAAALAGGAPGALATAIATAFQAFWVPVAFAAPGIIGAFTAVPPPPALANSLGQVFAAGVPATGPAPSTAAQADALATVLHQWTRGVSVTNTPTGGTPVVVLLQ
jgi:hypothetical protein